MSTVLMEKEGAICNRGFPDTSYKTFFSFWSILFASGFGLGEKSLMPILHFSVRILGNIASVERKS